METILLIVVIVAKLVADVTFGKKALDEVGLIRVEMRNLSTAVTGRLDNHENRLDRIEAKS